MSEFAAPSSSSSAAPIPVLSYKSISPRNNNAKNSNVYPPLLHICGCYGIRHRLVGSCVSCGRVICDAETTATTSAPTVLCGCPTCGNAVLPPLTADQIASLGADSATIGAYQQKDKLMTFDREHAKRTHVNDAQSDYYESSTWLSEEEKKVVLDAQVLPVVLPTRITYPISSRSLPPSRT